MSDPESTEGAPLEGPKRKDYQGKKRGRKPKAVEGAVRADSSPVLAPINGFGKPFEIELQPGWKAYWASDRDLESMSYRDGYWHAATWDDPAVISYQGGRRPKSGNGPIKHKELHCYLMRTDVSEQMHANDPQRQVHRDRLNFQLQQARESEAGGRRGMANFIQR